MKKHLKVFLIASILLTIPIVGFVVVKKRSNLDYYIDLNDIYKDQIKVKLLVKELKPTNNIFQFVTSAPGTYQVLDIGRFVRDFSAYDESGNILKTERISTNQWKIDQVEKAIEIRYNIVDMWDTVVDKNQVHPFFGVSIENDHVLLNSHCVFGFLSGLQNAKLRVNFDYPKEWLVGTPLTSDSDGYFNADNFDHIVDSPFLFGRLSKSAFTIENVTFEIYTYSKTDKIKSEQLKLLLEEVLTAELKFMKKFPIDHYVFLFHFENAAANGALEHNNSSVYTFGELDYDDKFRQVIATDAAHEFFHVVTPLQIRSENIEYFDFANPVPSEHLWFYEGLTEWASDMMLVRGGVMNLKTLLDEIRIKLFLDKAMDQNYSLSKLSLNCYTQEGYTQNANIYHRGAIVASLLDIRLLELSEGKKGLREVVFELGRDYKQGKPFSEKEFFETFVKITYPEIRDFLDKFVKNTNPLPIAEVFNKVGINYVGEVRTGNKILTAGYELFVPAGRIRLRAVTPKLKEMGLQDSDELIGFNEYETRLDNINEWAGKMQTLKIGELYSLKVRRGEDEKTMQCKLIEIDEVLQHVFTVLELKNEGQKSLHESWMKNL